MSGPEKGRTMDLDAKAALMAERLTDLADALNDGRKPTPHDLHRAVKRPGQCTGWAYEAVPFGLSNFREAAEVITEQSEEIVNARASANGWMQIAQDLREAYPNRMKAERDAGIIEGMRLALAMLEEKPYGPANLMKTMRADIETREAALKPTDEDTPRPA